MLKVEQRIMILTLFSWSHRPYRQYTLMERKGKGVGELRRKKGEMKRKIL
jgi:hypothetical protein